jgi:hypothetical protein
MDRGAGEAGEVLLGERAGIADRSVNDKARGTPADRGRGHDLVDQCAAMSPPPSTTMTSPGRASSSA